VAPELLQACLKSAADRSFNAISIDGDTSTNDACVLAATGALGNPPIADEASVDYAVLQAAVESVCVELATAIVRDGEGATKLVTVRVERALDREEARRVAYTIAHSPLVKTALFASDPNWGRILAAVGRAGVTDLVIEDVDIWLGDVRIVESGGRAADYTEQAGAAVMAESEILIRVALGRGEVEAQVLTCDFSYDYVRINAEYRS
jgi:glutamate N-acetyltransferase/amino-acid N-acetyltransferase